jgi:predicted transcriptional regulator
VEYDEPEVVVKSKGAKKRAVKGSKPLRGGKGRQVVELLKELRERRGVTQVELAERLGVSQASVSKLERRGNVSMRTLRGFVEGVGGELEVKARFGDETVSIELAVDPAPISR